MIDSMASASRETWFAGWNSFVIPVKPRPTYYTTNGQQKGHTLAAISHFNTTRKEQTN